MKYGGGDIGSGGGTWSHIEVASVAWQTPRTPVGINCDIYENFLFRIENIRLDFFTAAVT